MEQWRYINTGGTMELTVALEFANKYRKFIEKFVDKVELTGDIRREEPSIEQIKLLVKVSSPDLDDYLHIKKTRKEIIVIKNASSYRQIIFDKNVYVNLFIANDDNYGIVKLFTTGNKNFNKIIIKKIKEKNLYWGGDNLNTYNEYLRKKIDGSVIKTNDEEEVFDILNMKYLAPTLRNM